MRGDGTVYRQSGSRFWWIQYFVRGERRRESTKTENEKLAWRMLRTKLAEIDAGELSAGSADRISSLYQALERDYTINKRKDIGMVRSRWKNHLEPFFGGRQVSQVNADTIADYIAARAAAANTDPPESISLFIATAALDRAAKTLGRPAPVPSN